MTAKKRGWFADIDPDMKAFKWQPCIKTDDGGEFISPMNIWFATKEGCEEWIRECVLGVEMLDD